MTSAVKPIYHQLAAPRRGGGRSARRRGRPPSLPATPVTRLGALERYLRLCVCICVYVRAHGRAVVRRCFVRFRSLLRICFEETAPSLTVQRCWALLAPRRGACRSGLGRCRRAFRHYVCACARPLTGAVCTAVQVQSGPRNWPGGCRQGQEGLCSTSAKAPPGWRWAAVGCRYLLSWAHGRRRNCRRDCIRKHRRDNSTRGAAA